MERRVAELVMPAAGDLAAAVALVAERVDGVAGRPRARDRVLLDTFDGRLRAAGVTAERPARGAADWAPTPAALAAAGGRALLPVARVRGASCELVVRNADEKTVARVEVEQPDVVRGAGRVERLSTRVRVREVLGYGRAYDRALAALARDGLTEPAARTLFDEASLATGRAPAGVSSKVSVDLRPDTRADAAAGALLSRLADVAEANLPGTLADHDAEFLHDLRVAVRRARSVLRELDGVHAPEERARARAALRWIQQATGPARDLDVQLEDWDALTAGLPAGRRADLEPLHAVLASRRAAVLEVLRAALTGPRMREGLDVWRALAEQAPADDGDPARPLAAAPIAAVAAERISRVHRRMVRDGRAITDASPDAALHDLRKRGKELRYLLELFGPLFPADVVRPMVAALKRLQDVLGRFQDRAVQATLLEAAGRELVRRRSGPSALMALGLVVEQLEADQRAARAAFAERFAAFAAPEQRRLVRSTFAPAGAER